MIKKGLSKAKIVDFVRRKLNKHSSKVRYIKKRKKKTQQSKPYELVNPQNINQLINNQIEKQADQIEKQAEAMATTPQESELFRQSKNALVLLAKNAGIKYPYRKTKLQLISDLTELASGTELEEIERKYNPNPPLPRGRPPGVKNKPTQEEKIKEEKIPEDLQIVEPIIEPPKLPLKKPRGRPPGIKNKPKPPDNEASQAIEQGIKEELKQELKEDLKEQVKDELLNEIDDVNLPVVDLSPEEIQARNEAYDIENAGAEKEREEFRDLYGYGMSNVDNTDALSNIQIDKIMKPYGDKYLGCVSCDTIKRDILPKIKPKSMGCFVVNTDKEKGPGEHWISVFFDATPKGSQSLEYYDSYGDSPDVIIDKSLQEIADKLDSQNYLKYKINSVCWQGLKNGTKKESSNCGYFAVKFLIDRLRGKSFQESTCYDASKIGERNIEKFKDREKIHKDQIGGFGFLPSFGKTIETIKEKVFFPARELSNAFKSVMNKYGNLKVIAAKIRRAPIGSAINSILNLLSLGKFEEYRREKNFDKFYHLGIVLELAGGKKLLLEKNAKPEFSENFKDSSDTVYMGPIKIHRYPTLNEFIQRTIDKEGIYKFTNYDPFKNNCQAFILMLLEANDSLTPQLKNFIYQDVQTLLERIPSITDKIARFATDTGAKLQELTGNGKKHHRFTTARRKAIKKLFKNILS